MWDASKRTCVVYNGEIYNFKDLKAELGREGTSWRTQSDTEVLLQGYRTWGIGVLDRLNGMFAFAIWDVDRRRLFLARDRMGQKPLFYSHLRDGTFVFASELRALMASGLVAGEVEGSALASYLTYEYVPAPASMVTGVYKVEPGHMMLVKEGRVRKRPYWTLPVGAGVLQPEHGSSSKNRLIQTLDDSVALRLQADVPVGVLLSGGIDSSAVAASAARALPRGALHTFSIGFRQDSYDESAHARMVANHLGSTHHERIFDSASLLEAVDWLPKLLDEPLGDPSLLPTWLVSRFARDRVTVALGGDGADELFWGYPTFGADRFARAFAKMPAGIRRATTWVAERMPVSHRNFSLDFIATSFLRAADQPNALRHPLWLSSVVPGSPDDPLHPEMRKASPLETVLSPALASYQRPNTHSHLERVGAQYCDLYLANNILPKVDRASMAASLEVRAPFLDRRLVEFSCGLKASERLDRFGRGKKNLRMAVADRLPPAIVGRKKKGFGIPIAEWLCGPLKSMMAQYLSRSRLRDAGYFDPLVVERLMEEHIGGSRNHRKVLWTLLVFEVWREATGVGGRAS